TMAILLKEMGVLDEAVITASDLDQHMLERAMSVSCPVKNMVLNETNYRLFNEGSGSLEQYYETENGYADFDRNLYRQVSFVHQDRVTGGLFGQFDLMLCRNVMIYFNQRLQNDVLKKFHESLHIGGYLSIVSKESLIWCDYGNRFSMVNNEQKIYRKIKD